MTEPCPPESPSHSTEWSPPVAHSGHKELLLAQAIENLGMFVTATESVYPESDHGRMRMELGFPDDNSRDGMQERGERKVVFFTFS